MFGWLLNLTRIVSGTARSLKGMTLVKKEKVKGMEVVKHDVPVPATPLPPVHPTPATPPAPASVETSVGRHAVLNPELMPPDVLEKVKNTHTKTYKKAVKKPRKSRKSKE